MSGESAFGRTARRKTSLPRTRSATNLRIVSSERAPSACRLFLTMRAAKPAVARPSMKRALERGAHELDLLSREHIADHDLHQGSSAVSQRSNTRLLSPGKHSPAPV